ncbi:arylesterase [Candidatus Nitrotoga arctica]|uniref:Multifunctional acyl-CoA thioesterase I and protease I and lysophospholipase L1 n=1 Tax=Candidatus Nitrotoga arctica TaxID=453162 RepID=A0ABM8YZZ3_9PROT|nr:arylesterase [Candidatus Nitrotoga arctica]CAG9933121.1 multifunctional acyl-CoA thioesterase I and protease I and lysophospholipase L1 [Candidatus Nitrotoga arctica]
MKLLTFFKSVLLCACCLLSGVSGAQQQTILVFGDSLSAAYGIPRASGWVNLLQQEVQRSHPQYKVVNASISGETTSGGRQRIAPALRQHSPSIVILELGANDGLRGTSIADIETNLSAIIQQSRKSNRKVLLVGIQLPPNYGKNYTDQFKALYSRLAQRHKVELVPFMLKDVQPEQFQADNLHPTASAQAQILQTILDKLKPLLQTNHF